MEHAIWLNKQAHLTLQRLRPRLEPVLKHAPDAAEFDRRLNEQFPRLFDLLLRLYGDQYDFFYQLEQILLTTAQLFIERPDELKSLDGQREANPHWFQSEQMAGGVCYVDLFNGNLQGIREKIPYFKELGLTYLHLMPLFDVPETNSDGGYAVSDYRSVNPKLGTMAELAALAQELRGEGISLVLDFVFNHTSDEHTWAKKALAGDERYQNFYYMFDDRTLPDQYQTNLRDIFPEQSPGSFIYNEQINKWIWSTFWYFQWDLNYSNPDVFNAMLGEMLFLANQGVEVLRLDAVAFIWKKMGTPCENLPQAHWIIQAYNALVKIVAPAMIFKSEAIVHPNDVAAYIDWNEAPLSYNPTLMALLWESLATRKVELLQRSMARRFTLPDDCTWVNYVRVHDDIGWTFADEDAAELWINGFDHRQFLNRFYTGRFDGSFARGLPFNYNPVNQDMRITGTAASLAGLEQAVGLGDEHLIELALRRLWLIHGVIISAGGIPLIYLGDEIATLNDYSYQRDPEKRQDSRWVHRPAHDWERAEMRHNPSTVPGRMFNKLQHMLKIRREHPVFGPGTTTFFDTRNPHVLGYVRSGRLMVLGNFSEEPEIADGLVLNAYAPVRQAATELISGQKITIDRRIELEPYACLWLLYE